MANELDYEKWLKQDLAQKADEVKPLEEMLTKIIERIEYDRRETKNFSKGRVLKIARKRLIITSLCVILVIGGVVLSVPNEVRAEIGAAIQTIFVLDKSDAGTYKIIEKTNENMIFTPVCGKTSFLDDAELTDKMEFNVHFPEEFDKSYKLDSKEEAIGIDKKVSLETWKQLVPEISRAIDDNTVFDNLKEYGPYRIVYGYYLNPEGRKFAISMMAAVDYVENDTETVLMRTKVGNANAVWEEEGYLNYNNIGENETVSLDFSSKPENIDKMNSLEWYSNGVKYSLIPIEGAEPSMDEAVKLAESFMTEQK